MLDLIGRKKTVIPQDDREADVVLKPYTGTSTEPLHDAHFTASQMVALTSLLKALPPTIQAMPLLQGTYVLSFTPEIASKLSAGTATLMNSATHDGIRAIAVGADGRILGHGTLVAAQGLQVATAVVSVWQVLAIVTAQHYLPDIQQKLMRLESSVQELRQWMEADEKAKLIACITSLQQFTDIALAQPLLEDKIAFWCQHIEHLYFESHQISEASQFRLRSQVQQLNQINTADWFNIDQNYNQVMQTLDKLDSTASILLFALSVQIVAANCLTHLNHYPAMQEQRLRSIPAVLENLKSAGETIVRVTCKKIMIFGGPIDPWGHDAAKKRRIAKHLEHKIAVANNRLLKVIRLADQSHTYMERQSLLSTEGTSLIIDTDDVGNIVRVSTVHRMV